MKSSIESTLYTDRTANAILPFPTIRRESMHREDDDKVYLRVRGGVPLKGETVVSGSKNASLGVIAASLLTEEPVCIRQAPALSDVRTMVEVLAHMGSRVALGEGVLHIDNGSIREFETPFELMNRMRASIYVMGPLLARYGRARVALPGGCMIGSRPIDFHLNGFAMMGAELEKSHGYVDAVCERLKGVKIHLDFPSVGATINLMMAATLAEGTTTLENAAEEPHVADVARFLRAMGARIAGDGTKTIVVEGVERLHGAEHVMIPDQIEAGTYMAAAAATGGSVFLRNVAVNDLQAITAKMMEAGVSIEEDAAGLRVSAPRRPAGVKISAMPHPGFPTDMQPQMMALLSIAEGVSVIRETVWENRFMHVAELVRMGADIEVEGNTAIVKGQDELTGSRVASTDLRAGAALAIAALAARNESMIFNVHYIDRGYENIEGKMRALGGDVVRVSGDGFEEGQLPSARSKAS